MSKSTAYEYLRRLTDFAVFVVREYDSLTVDGLITKVKKAVYDPYSILSRYAAIFAKLRHYLHTHFEAACCDCEKLFRIS